MDVLPQIRQSPMARFQVMAVVIALTLILFDGSDVAVMVTVGGLVAPLIPVYGWQPERIFFFFAIPLATAVLCSVLLCMSLKRIRPPTPADTALAPTSPAAYAELILSPSRHRRKIYAVS